MYEFESDTVILVNRCYRLDNCNRGVFPFSASMRLSMGPRRGFICRLKVGNMGPDAMAAGHLNRLKQRNSLGPSRDNQNYAVVHCTGYIKNWPPSGTDYGLYHFHF